MCSGGSGRLPDRRLLPEGKRAHGAADACRRTGRRLWFVPQVNTHKAKVVITEQKLRYQANMAMAFGAETLMWACWTKGWWTMNVLDENGAKTVQYDRLKHVNAEIKGIAPRWWSAL